MLQLHPDLSITDDKIIFDPGIINDIIKQIKADVSLSSQWAEGQQKYSPSY